MWGRSEGGVRDASARLSEIGASTRLSVLLIDDDADLREVLVLLLARFYQVEEAATVERALAMVAARPFDVVLCDVTMPDGGAESWLSRCASLDPQLDKRTILLTGGPITAASTALVEARGERVLIKPLDFDHLRPLIERIAQI